MEVEALKKILAYPSALTVKLNGINPKDISPYLHKIAGKEDEYDFRDILICLGFILYEYDEDLLCENDEPAWSNKYRGLHLLLEYLRYLGVLDYFFRFSEEYKKKSKLARAHVVRAIKEKFNWRNAWKEFEVWNKEKNYRLNSEDPLTDPEVEKICEMIKNFDISFKKVR